MGPGWRAARPAAIVRDSLDAGSRLADTGITVTSPCVKGDERWFVPDR
jgi:hypothetical protein